MFCLSLYSALKNIWASFLSWEISHEKICISAFFLKKKKKQNNSDCITLDQFANY